MIDLNDPRITAYALGEMSDKERKAFEKEIEGSPEAREAIEEVRHMAEVLKQELCQEPTASLTPDERRAVSTEASGVVEGPKAPKRRKFLSPYRMAKIAALLLVVLATGYVGRSYFMLSAKRTAESPVQPKRQYARRILNRGEGLDRLQSLGYLGSGKPQSASDSLAKTSAPAQPRVFNGVVAGDAPQTPPREAEVRQRVQNYQEHVKPTFQFKAKKYVSEAEGEVYRYKPKSPASAPSCPHGHKEDPRTVKFSQFGLSGPALETVALSDSFGWYDSGNR